VPEGAGTSVFGGARTLAATPMLGGGAGQRASRRTARRCEVVVCGDEREAGEGGALGERAEGDEGEGNERVLAHEQERVNPYE
jgi:hypothetical protein